MTIATEHAAVLDTVAAEACRGRTVTILPVGRDGIVDLDAARTAIGAAGGGLVAAMLVNNEIGVIQPLGELTDMARAAEATLLCDAVQGFGRQGSAVHPPMPSACRSVAHASQRAPT